MAFTLTTPTATAYPNLLERNQAKKLANKGEHIAQSLRAFIYEVINRAGQHWYPARERYNTQRLYAMGKQETGQYERFQKATNRRNDPTGVSGKIDKRVLQVGPKYLKIAAARLMKLEYDPDVQCLDEEALQDKKDVDREIKLWREQGDFLATTPKRPGPQVPEDLPETAEEQQLFMEVGYKHYDALNMELKMALSLQRSNYTQLMGEFVQDGLRYESFCPYVHGRYGMPLVERLHPKKCLFLPGSTEDYRGMRMGAHLETISLGQLRAEAGDQISPAQYKELEELSLRMLPGDALRSSSLPLGMGQVADMGTLEIVRFAMLSEDEKVRVKKRNKRGNIFVEKKGPEYQNTKGYDITRTTETNVYEGVLVLTADIAYNCRLMPFQQRELENPNRSRLPYRPFTPDLDEGEAPSLMQQLMPLLDMIQREWLQLQDALGRAVPNGYRFNRKILRDVVMKSGEQPLGIREQIEMFFRSGIEVSEGVDLLGNPTNIEGITKKENGIPADVVTRWTNIRQGIELIEGITGVNATVAAATPDPQTGKAVGQMAIEGADNAMFSYARTKAHAFEETCRALMMLIRASEDADKPITGTVQRRPEAKKEKVGAAKSMGRRSYEMIVTPRPTTEEWQELYTDARTAMGAGQLEYSDYVELRETPNLKKARWTLAVRMRKTKRLAQAKAAQDIQMNAQVQTQSGQAVETAKQATVQMKMQGQMALEQLKGQNMLANTQAVNAGLLAVAQEQNAGKLQNQAGNHLHEEEMEATGAARENLKHPDVQAFAEIANS